MSFRRGWLGLILAAVMLTAFSGCASKENDALPPVVTKGLPSGEKVSSTIVSGGFTFSIYRTYAEVTGYSGSEAELVIPESVAGVPVRLIGESSFQNKTFLKKVTLPSGTRVIDRFAFDGCASLSEVVFNDGLESVSDYAFRNSGLTVLELPDSVAGIGKYSFYACRIGSLTIPASVSALGKYAFYGCTELKTITFCPRLAEIGERVFYNCTSLTELVIPKTVKKLEAYAFSSCTSLVRIVIPAETESLGEGVFQDCPALTIYAPAGSAAEKSAKRNGYRFEAVDYDAAAGAAS